MKTIFKANLIISGIETLKIIRETKKYYFTIDGESIYKDEYIVETYKEAKRMLLDWSSKQIAFYQFFLQKEVDRMKKIIEL